MVSNKNISMNIRNAKYSVISQNSTTGVVTYGPFVDIPNLATIQKEPEKNEGKDIFGDGATAMTVYKADDSGTLTLSLNSALSGVFREETLGYVKNSVGQYANRVSLCKPKIMLYFEEVLSNGGGCKGKKENIRKWLYGDVELADLTEEREAMTKDPAENSQEVEGRYIASSDPDWRGHSFVFMDNEVGVDTAVYTSMGLTPKAPMFSSVLVGSVSGGSATLSFKGIGSSQTKFNLNDLTAGTSKEESLVGAVQNGVIAIAVQNLITSHTYNIELDGEILATFTA